MKKEIPFWEKSNLTIEEAAAYFVSVKSSALKFNPIHAKLEKTQKTN